MKNIFIYFCSFLVQNIIKDINNDDIEWEYKSSQGTFYKSERFINKRYNYDIHLHRGTINFVEIISYGGKVELGLYDRIILNRYLKKLLSTVLLNKNKK